MKQIPFIAPRDRTIRDRLIALLIVFAVLVVGSIGYNIYLISAHKSSTSEPLPITGIGVTNKPNGDVIGISDGSYAFDARRADGDLKLQASEKLRNGDKSGAILQWQDVVKKETNDAEALIYLEDQNVLRSGKPYITLIVGTMLTGNNASAVSTGLDTLQGAYVAQKEYNDGSKLQGGNLLRLLIANSGSQVSYTTAVAQQITAAAKYDKTILGIIGWSFSDNAYNAVKVLEQVHLPMVSPTASADTLTHISPYF